MPDKRKPMLSPEEMAFVKGGESTPAADATPTPAPKSASRRRSLPPPPEPAEATVRFTVDMKRSQHEQLKRAALDARMPMTALIRYIVTDWLEADGE
jgi:hypothetical protein